MKQSLVVSERVGRELGAVLAVLENMGDSNCGWDPLDPALRQFEARVVAHIEVVQSLGLGPTHVTGRGVALRVRVGVVADKGLPVLIPRSFDRLSNVLPIKCHGS